jgi:NAD(P)-dependent dehydrogenase (short-subunit alcohol dehydrogenase family)
MSRHLALAALALTLAAPAQASSPAVPSADSQSAQRAVLITGASSGFGRAATELLASKGWNAGVGGAPAPLNDAEERDLTYVFDVNVYGPRRVTKAFATLLAESKGRVVNISSIAGFVATPLAVSRERAQAGEHDGGGTVWLANRCV